MSVKTSHYNIVLFGVKSDTYDLYKEFEKHIDLIITLDENESKKYHIAGKKSVKNLVNKQCYYSNSYTFSSNECKKFF